MHTYVKKRGSYIDRDWGGRSNPKVAQEIQCCSGGAGTWLECGKRRISTVPEGSRIE